MTLIDILSQIRAGQNPQQITMELLEDMAGATPMGANLISLAKQGKYSEIEKIARNMTEASGGDFDTEFNAFRRKFGL